MLDLDLKMAWRRLTQRGQRSFSIGALATLTVAVAALVVIAQFVYAVLLAPLPFADADAVVEVGERNVTRDLPSYAVSTPNFRSWQETLADQAQFAAIEYASATLGSDGERDAARVASARSTHNLWQVLGLDLVAGSAFDAAHERSGAPQVALISERLWRQRYARDAATVGAMISIDEVRYQIIGVAPNDVGFSDAIDVWLPLTPNGSSENRGDRRLSVWARLAPGVGVPALNAALATTSARLAAEFARDDAGWDATAMPARQAIVGADVQARLLLLLAAVLLLLLLSCANIANLQIARAMSLASDHALRRTLGSSRWGMLRLPLLESLLLGMLGALLGLSLALALTGVLAAFAPADLPRLHALRFDPAVAAGVALLSVMMMALGGLLPGWLALRAADTGVIGHGARATPAAGRLRSGLVLIQFALASLLLSGASVLGVQLLALLRTDPGFDSAHLLIARISLPEVVDDASHQRALAGYERLLEDVRALPGVRSAAVTNEVPMGELDTGMEVVAGADPAQLYAAVQASWRIVSTGYLNTLGAQLLHGRDFQASAESPTSIMLSEGLARRLWPDGQQALGREVTLGNGRTHQVVGIVSDVRQTDLAAQPTPTMYLPTSWYLWPTMTLTVRSSGDPGALIGAVRARAAALFPERPLFDVQPLQRLIDADSAAQRQQFAALAAFALASLLLAGIGIAASMSYAIAQRRRELAVRMAVGASARRLQLDVVRSGAMLSGAGLLLGALLALPLLQFAGSQITLPPEAGAGAIPALLGALVLGALASAIAARRITAIAPAGALRSM